MFKFEENRRIISNYTKINNLQHEFTQKLILQRYKGLSKKKNLMFLFNGAHQRIVGLTKMLLQEHMVTGEVMFHTVLPIVSSYVK